MNYKKYALFVQYALHLFIFISTNTKIYQSYKREI